ncbi:MAG: GyrI-like domain-containing protein, partial [Candidatus Marinimicrobia bacterium]|nr:GyrI-like domain-containing protein [Candidatus Neomarinimicrobiota bacterium]
HVGPYTTEPPTIQKLMDYITSQGYTIIGPHEEEYLKGPTMFGKGNPEKYKTIIRYQVAKKM